MNVVIVIILSYFSLAGLLTIVLAVHNQHHVHPDDTLCLQPPFHTLEYFTNNSDVYFVSYTTLLFGQGEYYHTKSDLIVQNVINVSLIGTPNTTDPTSPVSVIKCLPEHLIYFYNTTNLLINLLRFEDCGCLVSKVSEVTSVQNMMFHHYWAATIFQYCMNVIISNTHIYKSVGCSILTFNVMGNNIIVNVTVVMGGKEKYDGTEYASPTAYLRYKNAHGNAAKSDDITFSIDNVVLKDAIKSCDYDESTLEIDLKYSTVFISIKNSNFTNWNGSRNMNIRITSPSSPFMIYFYKCNFISSRVTNDLIYFWYNPSCMLEPYGKVNFMFDEVTFLHARRQENNEESGPVLIRFNMFSRCFIHKVHLTFSNVGFYYNELAILKVTLDNPPSQNQSSIMISMEG